MQPWHEMHGAKPLVAGTWIRPDHYGDPASEVLNVRENVGIIDVTPLGKFDLRGPDVPRLLNHLYVNGWDNLDVGAVRYGMMCLEDGVIFDDVVRRRRRVGVDRQLAADRPSTVADPRHPRDHGVREHQRRRTEVPRVTPAPDRGR